ncbi:MAG TPA: alpha/beta fold hydrolase [Actinomycetes bacterium]
MIAVDQRGIGLSDKPQDGYDTGTLAGDLVALMDALGHQRFAMYGTDTSMPIAYAVAADHRDRLDRLVVSEAPPGRVPLAAAVLPRSSTPGSGTSPSTSSPPRSTSSSSGDGRTSSSARNSPPRPGPTSSPTTRSATTSTAWPPTPRPCGAASSSTAPSPPSSPRTSSARNGG